ncbi:MAG: hypothetical protein ACRDT6_16395 [Micromonosporaceae bacterium]
MTTATIHYGTFTRGAETFSVEGHERDERLYVSKLLRSGARLPLCEVTCKDAGRHELTIVTGDDWPQAMRDAFEFHAVATYRTWLADGPDARGDRIDEEPCI